MRVKMLHLFMCFTLGFIQLGGSHISVTWMHAKVPHIAYMAYEWIVHMACEWVTFKGHVSGKERGHHGAPPLP